MRKLLAGALALALLLAGCAGGPADQVLARYGDKEITRAAVDSYRRELAIADAQLAEGTDREIVDMILENVLLYEEAERRGCTAAQEEVDDWLAAVRTAYYDWPEEQGKQPIDEYCAEEGITAEEYFDRLAERLPGAISRLNVKNALAREYCEAHGLEYTTVDQPAEVQDYVRDYIDGLLAAHRDEIIYDRSVS